MAVYSVRIDSDAEWNVVEITSAATWARAPGRALRYEFGGEPVAGVRLVIDDRTIHLSKTEGAAAPVTLVVQIATTLDRVALHTDKGRGGTMRLTSAADSRVNDRRDEDANPLDVVLFLAPAAAATAGATGGDASLA